MFKQCRVNDHMQYFTHLCQNNKATFNCQNSNYFSKPMPVFCGLNLLKYSSLRYGSEANQQTCLRPGFWADLKATISYLRSPTNFSFSQEERSVPGGDPEETGGCRGKKKGNFFHRFLNSASSFPCLLSLLFSLPSPPPPLRFHTHTHTHTHTHFHQKFRQWCLNLHM